MWLLDQWRKIGLNVTQRVMESSAWFAALRAGDFDMSIAAWCGYIVEPDLDLAVFLSSDKADGNYGRYTDRVLDTLYEKQGRSRDVDERKRYVREFGSGCSTSRSTWSRCSGGTASSRTTRACADGRSRRATT